jgi:hypothetical protein
LSPGIGSHLSSILSCIVSQTKESDYHGSPDLINTVRRSNVTRDSDFRTKSPGGKNSVFPSVPPGVRRPTKRLTAAHPFPNENPNT